MSVLVGRPLVGAAGAWRDPAAVARLLADRGVEVSPPVEIRRIGIGQSNLTSQVSDAAGRSWVLREPPSGAFGSARDMAHETRMLDALDLDQLDDTIKYLLGGSEQILERIP